jgi:6-pyruvoyltetrahydropterin/6-carboxytetrahydropterin synthase
MYRVGVKKRFSAAHRLEGHEGKCSRLHGHTWCVEAVFSSVEVGREGMAIDFDVAGSILEKVIAPYDHRYLNELEPFTSLRPTAENVARVLFTGVLKEIEGGGHPIRLAEVKVWESPDSWASYGGG